MGVTNLEIRMRKYRDETCDDDYVATLACNGQQPEMAVEVEELSAKEKIYGQPFGQGR